MASRLKNISLDDRTFEISSKMENFSGWVREKLLEKEAKEQISRVINPIEEIATAQNRANNAEAHAAEIWELEEKEAKLAKIVNAKGVDSPTVGTGTALKDAAMRQIEQIRLKIERIKNGGG